MEWVVENDPRLPNWLNTILNWPPFLLPMECIFLGTSRGRAGEIGQNRGAF